MFCFSPLGLPVHINLMFISCWSVMDLDVLFELVTPYEALTMVFNLNLPNTEKAVEDLYQGK